MKTKTKKTVAKKVKTQKKKPASKNITTVGEFFARMLKESDCYDHICYGPHDNPWDLSFVPGYWNDNMIHICEDVVTVYGTASWPNDHEVTIRGDTAEIKADDGDYVHLFRFYKTQRVELN